MSLMHLLRATCGPAGGQARCFGYGQRETTVEILPSRAAKGSPAILYAAAGAADKLPPLWTVRFRPAAPVNGRAGPLSFLHPLPRQRGSLCGRSSEAEPRESSPADGVRERYTIGRRFDSGRAHFGVKPIQPEEGNHETGNDQGRDQHL